MTGARCPVLVVGPARSGVSGVVGALRDRLGGHRVVELLDTGEHPAAVVFVVSAAAPLTESDAALLDAAAVHTDAVVAAVSKIDVHRTWPLVLHADRALLAGHSARYARVAWVPVAADPHIGQVRVDLLVAELKTLLSTPVIAPPIPLRPRDSQLRPRTMRALVIRSQIQQSRVHIGGQVRTACMTLRTDLRSEAAEVNRGEVDEFCTGVRRRVAEVAAEVDSMLTSRVTDLADGLEVSVPPCPPLESYLPRLGTARLENRLSILLSAGFGLGAALTVGRVLADTAGGQNPAVIAAALAAGVMLTWWVIRSRALLAQRAALDRWVSEVTAGLRAAMDDRVVTRLLAAEFALAAAAAAGELAAVRRFPDPAWSDRP